VSIQARISWALLNKHLNVLTHRGHMKSPNWVASCAAETEAILPYLTDVKWDSTWATHGVSIEAYAWKTCTRVRWTLIVSLTSSWIVATHGALRAYVCRVVRFIPVQVWLLIQISTTPSDFYFSFIFIFLKLDDDPAPWIEKLVNMSSDGFWKTGWVYARVQNWLTLSCNGLFSLYGVINFHS
jgi:hypothetical protein